VSAAGSAFDTVLFDLDGTLVDTAPDMGGALNALRAEHDLPPLDAATIRPHVSHGGLALVKLGFGAERDPALLESLRLRFLEIYRDALAVGSRPFAGIDALLAGIEARGLRWGVVTNKPGWLTDPLLLALDLSERAACVVSGDTTANKKPHPEPLLHACQLIDRAAAGCLYVGDALRDIQAGRAAGMTTIVANYGYIGPGEDPAEWGAHGAIDTPQQLLSWLQRDA